jgi:hypothetical protein
MAEPQRSQTQPLSTNNVDPDVVEGRMQPNEQALVTSDYYQEPARPAPKKRRLRRRGGLLQQMPRFTIFVLATALIVGGVFFTLLNLNAISGQAAEWWPAVALGVAIIWALVSVIRRDATAFVAGATVAGVSLSFLLEAQEIATFGETVAGIILITLGLSVVIRGLFIRPRTVRQS